jgi:hypothetical protein
MSEVWQLRKGWALHKVLPDPRYGSTTETGML